MTALSYVSGPSQRPLLGRTIGAELDRVARETPEALAVVSRHQDVRLSYGELIDRVERAARGLLALGVAKGDRVGIWAGNSVEWLVTQYATAKIGAILVNVNPAYRRHELEYALSKSGVSLLVAARSFRQTDYLEMLRVTSPRLPALDTIVLLGEDAPGMLGWTRPPRPGRDGGHRPPAGTGGRPRFRRSRSTSSTPRAPPGFPRAPPSPITTSSTTATSSGWAAATPPPTGSASRSRSTTASGW